MIYKFEQVQQIVLKNPKKEKLEKAVQVSNKLRLHVLGEGMKTAVKQCKEYASDDMFAVQQRYAVSNMDVFEKILGQEDMIFTTKGGTTKFNMPDADEQAMNALLDEVTEGISLRKWVQLFALQAYRTDPMGVIFVEIDEINTDNFGNINTPKCYPTYKATKDIYDYDNYGRKLQYVVFNLTVKECIDFGIEDEQVQNLKGDQKTKYFRFIDDAKDIIVKKEGEDVSLATNMRQPPAIKNIFGRVPGFITSDLVTFDDINTFNSPLQKTIELADTFLQDRSIRDLQKYLHGFAKTFEPLVDCPKCKGEKQVDGDDCPACVDSITGKPTGYRLKTKVSDSLKLPLTVFDGTSGFDVKKIFGYISPDIDSWDKQDTALYELYISIYETYWGTRPGKQATTGEVKVDKKTATEVRSDQKPIESRLNKTTDWAQSTTTMVANLIGAYWFPGTFKQANILYSRDWVLLTAEELLDNYQLLLKDGAPDSAKDEAFEKYLQAKFETNPMQLQKYLKMLDVEPFPHDQVANVEKSSIIKFEDKCAKRYYGEWANTIPDIRWATVPATILQNELKTYIAGKSIVEPKPAPAPGFAGAN